jgi:RHS repeat-associated protein
MAGQTATLLPDGRVLKIGGLEPDGPIAEAIIQSARIQLQNRRAWHTATMLPDGRVLIVGGIGASGQLVDTPEILNPETLTSQTLGLSGLTSRVYHSATLLTEGLVLIAGGVSGDGAAMKNAELWDFRSQTVVSKSKLREARYGHEARLLPDGNVLLSGGDDSKATALNTSEMFNARTRRFRVVSSQEIQAITRERIQSVNSNPILAGSLPEDRTTDVNTNSIPALRFSKPLKVDSVNSNSVKLAGPSGVLETRIVPAEGGMLAFVTSMAGLLPNSVYSLTVNGCVDLDNNTVKPASITFSTSRIQGPPLGLPDDEDWIPNEINLHGNWRSNRPDSEWRTLKPLQGLPGATALAGQSLMLNGKPLAEVTIQIGNQTTKTDQTGRFLLSDIPAGHQVMIIDGRTANRGSRSYGVFKVGLDVKQGETTILPFTIWMTKLDTAHASRIPSPTKSDLAITNPRIPGLELRLPAQTVVRDIDGNNVTEISMTAVPVDRAPFPLPAGINVPVFFTVQPGGSVLIPPRAQIVYPNFTGEPAGARLNFWNYDPTEKGWYIYGQGTVTQNGKQIVPDAGVVIYEFSGIMISTANRPDGTRGGPSDGDPVNLGTGLFVLNSTDLLLPDVLAIGVKRTYRPNDTASYSFGIGAVSQYDLMLYDATPGGAHWVEAYLILPDGGRIRYDRISPGTGWVDAVLENTTSPSAFYKSRIKWNGTGWDLTLKDGTVFVWGDTSPLQSIRDRYGNETTIFRTNGQFGNITRVTSPNGRWIEFSYDSSNRITQAQDNIARSVSYTYDTSGRLWKVTNAVGGVTEYGYDSSHRMTSIKDARGNVYLTNVYDTNGRVSTQTQPDGGVYQFAYTISGGKVTQTDVTTPRGNVRRVAFNADGYATSETFAPGTSNEQAYTFELQSGTNFMLSVTDALGRKTSASYDSYGDPTSITRLAGTANALTTSFTYESTFNQLASVTDPLSHATNLIYDGKGNLVSVTDPLSNQGTYTYNTAGQPVSYTNAEGKTTQFTYDGGDLVRLTNPLGQSITRFLDSAGRVLSISNALGHTVRYQWDALNRPLSATDPLQGATTFTYDTNNNLLSVTDPRSKVISCTYDSQDHATARTDALGHADSYQYDVDGNLYQVTDRKSQVRGYTYDSLNRLTLVTYADSSTIGYTYDAGNRITQIVDSVAGTISYGYDGLNRLTSETTSKGTVSYAYDNAGRLTSLSVPGQSSVSYTYDNANRLTQITQGSSTVSFAYDHAGRTTSQTLANGVVTEYSYDDASHLTAITYKKSGTTLGNLTYAYDVAGRRIQIGGSYARTGLPLAITGASYNDGNRQTAFGSQTLSYDLNGNLTSDGVNSYTWNARDQLVSISGSGLSAGFQYDAVGRRSSKTVNSVTTGFLYDGDNIVQEQSGGSATANILGGGLDEFFGRTESSGTTTPLVDPLGSPIALADSSGVVQTQYTYDPFGSTSVSGTSGSNPSQYTGRENDGTGLYYYRARYYSPANQRFISEDPIGLLGGINGYAYAVNNPISFSDPYGLLSARDLGGWLVGLFDSEPTIGLGGPPPSLREMLSWGGITFSNCAYKAGIYTGIALQVAAMIAEPFLAPELEAEAAVARAEERAASRAESDAAGTVGGGDRMLPFSDAERSAGVNDTLDSAEKGGPYPYAQDGTVFRNKEGRLPQRPDGYYSEYTVNTPGAPGRAKRRIVQGKGGDTYYTDDHYTSFARIDHRRHP